LAENPRRALGELFQLGDDSLVILNLAGDRFQING
jgi:hypothetical protein